MYIPAKMEMASAQQAHQFIRSNNFASLITPQLEAVHAPFILDTEKGNQGQLQTHVARANKLWQSIEGQRVLIIFSGPHAYISPSWYAKSPAVPTWNYASAHVYGYASIASAAETLKIVEDTVAFHEPALLESEIMPKDYRQKLSRAIVGITIEIDDIQAKHKLGQHRHQEDQKGVAAALAQSKYADAQQLIAYMKQMNIGLGD